MSRSLASWYYSGDDRKPKAFWWVIKETIQNTGVLQEIHSGGIRPRGLIMALKRNYLEIGGAETKWLFI